MTTKRKPVVWCTPIVCAQQYSVLFVDADDPRLCGKEAITIWEDCLILISNDIADGRAPDALLHELDGHAIPEAYGSNRIIRERHGISEAKWRALEEDLACTRSVHSAATWLANGWLVLPPLPRRARPTKPIQLVAAKVRPGIRKAAKR